MLEKGFEKSLQLIRDAVTSAGILASKTEFTNYKRIWARDGIVNGLAGLIAEDELITAGLKSTLLTLAKAAGAAGQIPSNVQVNQKNDIEQISYGGVCGRVDTISWFIIGACHYIHFTNDRRLADVLLPAINKGFQLLKSWEFNSRGLIYVPQSGNWADEMIFHGYILYDQFLRLWALRLYRELFNETPHHSDIEEISALLKMNYWLKSENSESDIIYHPRAYKNFLDKFGEPDYFLVSMTPGGYFNQFDALSNALAVLLDIASEEQTRLLIKFGQSLLKKTSWQMIPCFHPPIRENDPEWDQLVNNHLHEFKNKPGQYQNGGVWAIINGWWGLALVKAGYIDDAHWLLNAIHRFNSTGRTGEYSWSFPEYGHADEKIQGGAQNLCWSAAGAVMLHCYLDGKRLFFG
ncbi:fructofuranosidase/invertase [candidate division KSB1 bacterium]|nr:fructofuranosidase/invertase [candidate division KSB1 bacterium]